MKIDVKIKLIEDGILPVYKTEGAACCDAYSRVNETIEPGKRKGIPLGFAVELPEGYEIVVRPRSGLSLKNSVDNCIGTIDWDYRGEVCAIVCNNSNEPFEVKKGDRICQLALRETPIANWIQVNELSTTDRGTGGFGHTGV